MRRLALILLAFVTLQNTVWAEDNLALRPAVDRPDTMQKITTELLGARLGKQEPLQILDVGTGRGHFILNLREFLNKRGYDNVEIEGVDDYKAFSKDAESFWRIVTGRQTEARILFADVTTLGVEFHDKYDFAFCNAPFPQSWQKVVEASMRLIKADGTLILRFHEGDNDGAYTDLLKNMADQNDWSVEMKMMELPEGEFTLSHETFFIHRGKRTWIQKVLCEAILGARLSVNIDRSA